MKILLAIFSLLVFVGTVSADSVWTYTGNTMSGCNCALDGTHALTQLTSTGFVHHSSQAGNPFQSWTVLIDDGAFEFFSQFTGSAFEATDLSFNDVAGTQFGFLQGNHGVWSQGTIATPEPATGLLVASGLLFVGLMRRKRRKPLDSATWDKLA
jgi:hypothetical protein